MKLPQSKGTDENVADAVAGTGFTIAEENLLLLGLQVQNLITQTSAAAPFRTLFDDTNPTFSSEIWPGFPRYQRDLDAKQISRPFAISLQGAFPHVI